MLATTRGRLRGDSPHSNDAYRNQGILDSVSGPPHTGVASPPAIFHMLIDKLSRLLDFKSNSLINTFQLILYIYIFNILLLLLL